MFLLALLGCQAFADANWKGEADLESNTVLTSDWWVRHLHPWRRSVMGWTVPKGTSFDEKGCIDHIQKKLNVTFKSHQIKKTEARGGTWIRGTVDGLELSAYMHPTKNHTAGIYCGKTGMIEPAKPAIAEPGCWAVAFGNAMSSYWNHYLYKIIE